MTDLELVRKCAERMGIPWSETFNAFVGTNKLGVIVGTIAYDPIHNDAQAMALVKKFGGVFGDFRDGHWLVDINGHTARNADLNRAICEVVANLP